MDLTPRFQPCQILCLEHGNSFLYAEVIQVVAARQLCWVRPLLLAVVPDETVLHPDQKVIEQSVLYDLRCGSDLLWPTILFRAALDTEVLPLLTQLGDSKVQSEGDRPAHKQLQDFIRRVWQAHSDVFQS